jgi:hypothetical protein
MARYKVLKSVAHSLGHSFTSLMNYRGNDYVMGHLLRRARQTGCDTLQVDLISRRAEPADLLIPEVKDSVEGYCAFLSQLVASHQTSMQYVRAASMSIKFNLAVSRSVRHAPGFEESPFLCRVEIVDDRGKTWSAEIRDWWYPEAGEPVVQGIKDRHSTVIMRLGQLIRSVWSPRRFERLAT